MTFLGNGRADMEFVCTKCGHKYKVQGITIPEDKILSAREKIARQGIYCEHTTAAVYAGYEHYCEKYGRPQEALLSMCGAGLKSDHA